MIHEALDGALKGAIWIEGGASSDGGAAGDDANNADEVGDAAALVASRDEPADDGKDNDNEVVEEVYALKTREEIDAIIESIDIQKAKGNEAFAVGEYAQALLFYTIALNNAAKLLHVTSMNKALSSTSSGRGGIG